MAAITALRPERPVAAAPSASERAPRESALRTAGRALRWVLTGLAVALLVRFARLGWPEVRESLLLLSAEQAPVLALAVLAEALWVLSMSQVYRSALMAFGGAVSRGTALRTSMAAFTSSRILPGGGAVGGAVAARELIALGNPALRTVVSMLTSWWITMTGLSALVFAGLGLSVARGTLPPGLIVVPGLVLAGFAGGGVAIIISTRSPRLRARMSGAILRGAKRLGPAVGARADEASLTTVGSDIRIAGLLAVFAWGVAVWVLDAAALWLSLAAFGWQTDIGVLLLAFGLTNLMSALPELTPGWLGVLEASVAVMLSSFGVPTGIAVVAVLLYRLISYWLPTAAGIPAAVRALRRPHRPATTSPRAREALR